MSKKRERLTDRERILTRLVDALAMSQSLAPVGRRWGDEAFLGHDGYPYAHFAFWHKPKAGDLVIGRTGGISKWKIGFYVEPLPPNVGGAILREIGGTQECEYANEEFVPIIGLSNIDLLEGDRYVVYQKVLAAFRKGDEYLYRFGGIKFEGEEVVIRIREVFGGLSGESQPFLVRMQWGQKTTVTQILDALRAGGYGTRSFRPDAAAPC